MSVLPSPIPDTSGSLSLHISSVPNINKTQFISSYLQEQTIHAKTHAAEGRVFERSWKHEEVQEGPTSNLEGAPEPQKALKLAIDYGFGTPVLKSRVTRRSEDSQKPPPTKDGQISNVGKGATYGNDVLETEASKRKRARSSGSRNTTKKPQSRRTQKSASKGGSVCGSEKDHEQRLKERRERKRVKRAVMKPASNDGSLDESSTEVIKEKKKMTKKTAKDRGLKGLALMHGFTATNVGAGRLTVKPALNVGVFNKGKASLKSRPMQRNKAPGKKGGKINNPVSDIRSLTTVTLLGHLGSGFIEGDFLNKTCKNSRERRAASGSSSSSTNSETSSSLGRRTKKRSRQTTQRLQKAKGSASNSVRLRSSPSIAENARETIKLDDRRPTESIIWDIEQEGATLPSHLSTSVSEKAISVLLDTKNISWSKVPVDLVHHDAFDLSCQEPSGLTAPSDDTEPRNKRHGDPSSIGPSESASQRGNLSATPHDPPAMEAASKYFVPVPQPQLPSEEKSPSKGVTTGLEIRKVVVIEPLACDFTHTDEKRDSLTLSSDVIATHNEKKRASHYDTLLHDLDDLPFVEPQDYNYSDYSLQLGSFEDLDCYDGILQAAMPSYSTFDDFDDEQTRSKNLYLYQWDELKGVHPQVLDFESTGYEEQYYTQEESLDDDEDQYDDGYESPECEARPSLSFGVGSEIWNGSPIHNGDSCTWNLEELGYYTGNLWQDTALMNNTDNPSISGDLDMWINNVSESGGSVDLTDTFTEGRALLRGYSESEARVFYSSMPCHQTQVSAAEADVANKLKNHWLPQRL